MVRRGKLQDQQMPELMSDKIVTPLEAVAALRSVSPVLLHLTDLLSGQCWYAESLRRYRWMLRSELPQSSLPALELPNVVYHVALYLPAFPDFRRKVWVSFALTAFAVSSVSRILVDLP